MVRGSIKFKQMNLSDFWFSVCVNHGKQHKFDMERSSTLDEQKEDWRQVTALSIIYPVVSHCLQYKKKQHLLY